MGRDNMTFEEWVNKVNTNNLGYVVAFNEDWKEDGKVVKNIYNSALFKVNIHGNAGCIYGDKGFGCDYHGNTMIAYVKNDNGLPIYKFIQESPIFKFLIKGKSRVNQMYDKDKTLIELYKKYCKYRKDATISPQNEQRIINEIANRILEKLLK